MHVPRSFRRFGAPQRAPLALALLLAGVCMGPPVRAAELLRDGEFALRWDNTLKYSAAYRVRERNEHIAGGDPAGALPPFAAPGPQLDDGDRNFERGLVSNRLDVLSEFDVTYRQYGMRLSGAGWYDTAYQHGNDNASGTANSLSVAGGRFTDGTRHTMGGKAELLDAFLFLRQC